MQKRFFIAVALITANNCLSAQTLTSQMGPVTYFNSLDSTKSAVLTKIAQGCYCVLNVVDTTYIFDAFNSIPATLNSVKRLPEKNERAVG